MPSNGCAIELEELLARICDAKIIEPVFQQGRSHPVLAEPLFLKGTPAERVLFIVALWTDLAMVIHALPGWRQEFGRVVAYVMDPWGNWSAWPDHVPKDFDCYFVPDIRVADQFRRAHGVHAHPVAMAADVLRYGTNHVDRPLDLVAYGRQPVAYLQVFKEAFNDPRSRRFLYHDTLNSPQCLDFRDNRHLIWKLLHKSRCALSFDVLATPEVRPGDRYRSILPLRYYEAAATGTAIVGRHPVVPEMETEFNWPDATIELPESPAEALPFLEALLDDDSRMNAIHRRNHAEAWRRHDWRYRIRDMFDHLGLPLPPRLTAELSILSGRPVSCEEVPW